MFLIIAFLFTICRFAHGAAIRYNQKLKNNLQFNIVYVNSRLVGYCNRFIYCIDNEFEIAYRMLKDFP